MFTARQTENKYKHAQKVISLFQFPIKIKHLNRSGARETDDKYISASTSVYVRVCAPFGMCVNTCLCMLVRPEPVCMYVCVCVLEGHLDWLRHLLHHTSGAWCDIWGIYCILPCNITHNLLLKVIMYPLIHF